MRVCALIEWMMGEFGILNELELKLLKSRGRSGVMQLSAEGRNVGVVGVSRGFSRPCAHPHRDFVQPRHVETKIA